MIHWSTAIQVSIVPSNLSLIITGGQACDRRLRNMSKDVQTVSRTKSIHVQYVPCSNQFTCDQKHYHSRR